MAVFNELIKNFEKIRDYMRDFLIYGYKYRNDYSIRSARSYDNERRRIENYLSKYVCQENSVRGKRLFITADSIETEANPLFAAWMSKSFTKNDIMLHFFLLDILEASPGLTVHEIADMIPDSYLSHLKDITIPDVMTIRFKLNEYVRIGFLRSEKKGRTVQYFLEGNPLDKLSDQCREDLLMGCRFFQNTAPIGVLGHFILQHFHDAPSIFSFRHLFMAHTLDDEILLKILSAVQQQRMIEFVNHSRKSGKTRVILALPINILTNVRQGRRYLAAYTYKTGKYATYRLDYIKDVELKEKMSDFKTKADQLQAVLSKSWGVCLPGTERIETLEMTLCIDEKTEPYILERLKREGKHGVVEKISKDTFVYSIEVTDTNEMLPWLRTFIGRIIAIKGSNKKVINRFINDIEMMAALYGGCNDGAV